MKTTFRTLLRCLFLCTALVVLIVVELRAEITYSCFLNGTISVENPNNTHFTHALAVDFELIGTEFPDPSNILCKLRMNEDKSKIIIKENNVGNCHRGNYIQLTLSTDTLSESIVVQQDAETENYRLRCREVPEEGVTVTVLQEFNPVLALFDLPPDMLDPGVFPNFESSVRIAMRQCCDYTTNPPIYSANVGEHIHMTLDVYHEFYLYPVKCDAYSGLTTTSDTKMALYQRGCSVEPSLIQYNTEAVFDGIRMYVMDFYVFHFYNSKYITIECTIKICGPDMEEGCLWNEGCDQRKKRSVQRSISDNETGSPRVREFASTHTTIQVNGYPEFYSKSASFKPWLSLLLLKLVILKGL